MADKAAEMRSMLEQHIGSAQGHGEAMTAEEISELTDRLKNLGYLE